jgi:hypothetical protein
VRTVSGRPTSAHAAAGSQLCLLQNSARVQAPAPLKRSRNLVRFGAKWGALLLAVGVQWHGATAQAAFELRGTDWQSCGALAALAEEHLGPTHVRLAETLDYATLRPGDGLLILAPLVPVRVGALSTFVASGGRVAVADDFGTGDQLWAHFRIHRQSAPDAPLRHVQGHRALPLAVPATPEHLHPMVAGITQVVANHPATLRADPGVELTPLLSIEVAGRQPAVLAATGVIGNPAACGLTGAAPREACGRLVSIADPSLFINLMLTYPDNRRLAAQLFDYLLEDDGWGNRGGTLYIVSGRFEQRGSGSANVLSDFLASLEERLSTIYRQWDLRNSGPTALAVVLLCGLGLWAGALAVRTYQGRVPQYALSDWGAPRAAFEEGSRLGQQARLLLEMRRTLEAAQVYWDPRGAGARRPEGSGAEAARARLRALEARLKQAERATSRTRQPRWAEPQVKELAAELAALRESVPVERGVSVERSVPMARNATARPRG